MSKTNLTHKDWLSRLSSSDFVIRDFIDGAYAPSDGGALFTKQSPRDGSALYESPAGSAERLNRAVASAKAAFVAGDWSNASLHHRKAVLHTLADLIEAHKEEFALYESLDTGKPITKALQEDIPLAAGVFRASADGADKLLAPSGLDGTVFTHHARKPIGIVGAIVGWNFPLTLAAYKAAPALAMGNAIVVKPSEFTSLSASRLAELAVEAGVPPGVFNVVHGSGGIVGDGLARHMDVGLLTFTGGTETGKKLMVAAGESNMKRLMLECGGKSPYIVFDDAPAGLDALAEDIVARAFPNQGALCVASTRLLLQKEIAAKLLPKILKRTKEIAPGDPLDPETSFGAIIHEAHLEKVEAYIQSGKADGAVHLYGGERARAESGGFYLTPAVFENVPTDARIWREEIFGPVLSVRTFETEEEAITLANDTIYGLAAFAVTADAGRLQRLGHKLEAGMTILQGGANNPCQAECGLHFGIEPQKQSGFGFDDGLQGLAAYSVVSQVQTHL